jgi:hypothetical protein
MRNRPCVRATASGMTRNPFARYQAVMQALASLNLNRWLRPGVHQHAFKHVLDFGLTTSGGGLARCHVYCPIAALLPAGEAAPKRWGSETDEANPATP